MFGWKIERWDGPRGYRLITTGKEDQPGINGVLMKRHNPSLSAVNTIGVSSVDDYVIKITENYEKVLIPKMTIPKVSYVACRILKVIYLVFFKKTPQLISGKCYNGRRDINEEDKEVFHSHKGSCSGFTSL